MEERVTRLESLVQRLQEENKELREKLSDTVAKEVKKETASYAATLKKNSNVIPGEVIQRHVSDLQERRLNLVLRGIKESEADEAEGRKRHDREAALQVAVAAGLDHDEFARSLTVTRRLGKKEDGKNFRPLLVRLESQELRDRALKGNRQLREENNKRGSRFRIDPDLTKEQMAHLNSMYEEARAKSKNGVKYYVVGKENPVLRYRRVEEGEASASAL